MKKLCVLLAIAFPLLSAAYDRNARMQSTPGSQGTAPDKSLIAQGRERYLSYKCDECHGANGEGGGEGPDLIGTRLNADEISKFLEKPSPDAYMKGMPNIPANHPDNQALVAYVLSLKRASTTEAHPSQPTPPPSEEPQKNDSTVIHKLSADEKAHILDKEFTVEKKVDRLPDSLKAAFARLTKERDFKMANPGEQYQATDYISEPGLPWRRLIFAGVSKDRYFIHYEKGGIAHTSYLAVFDASADGKVGFLWGGPGPRAADLTELRSFVSTKAFADSGNYW